MITNLFLISGKKGVGKDTLADMFTNDGYLKFALAEEVKFEVKKFLNNLFNIDLPIELFFKEELKDKELSINFRGKPLTARIAMQWFGTDVIKNNFVYSFWVDRLYNKIKNLNKNIIISDIRFPDEIERFHELCDMYTNIYTIRLEKDNDKLDYHSSENSFNHYTKDCWDFYFQNNSDIKSLENFYINIKSSIKEF